MRMAACSEVALTAGKPIVLGRISGVYGLQGWVKVHSYTEPREAILEYPGWMLERDGDWEATNLVAGRRHGKTVIASLQGVTGRDMALGYVGLQIGVLRDSLPDAGDGRFYWADLEGLAVVDTGGRQLGQVAYLLETGANDVMVVQGERGEILIPFVQGRVVQDVDLAGRTIRVDWEWE